MRFRRLFPLPASPQDKGAQAECSEQDHGQPQRQGRVIPGFRNVGRRTGRRSFPVFGKGLDAQVALYAIAVWTIYIVPFLACNPEITLSGLNCDRRFQICFRKILAHLPCDILMHINGTYVRHGDLDIHELFTPVDITDKVRAKLPGVNDNLLRIQAAIYGKAEPNIDFSLSCQKCVFWQYCSRNLPKPNVFDLPGTGSAFSYKHKLAIYKDGDIVFSQLRGRPELRERQILSVEGVLDGKTILRKDKIRAFLRTLTYPIYFLDYEGINPPIPPYDGTRPHHQTPFQYSLHWIEREGGELHHAEFLGNPEVSPLRDLAEQLCRDIPKDVCVIVYNDTYEKPVTRRLAELFPDLADHLLNICDHIKDLMIPFKNLDYYLPAMMGSYSIKYVLPALYPDDPELNYHNLTDVHKGTEASAAFMHMAGMPMEEREELRKNMLKYCCLDTYAMVKVWQKLIEISEN